MGEAANQHGLKTQIFLRVANSEGRTAKSAFHFSQEKMWFQSCFMLMTIQPLDFASS
jgi:hypothetical protein